MFGPYIEPGMTALDIGCGRGFASIGMARLVGSQGEVIAADLQPEMLAMVQGRAERAELADRIRLHCCEAHAIGLDRTVDFALAFWMAHEAPDLDAFLREVLSLLAPKGRFLLVEPKIHVGAKAFEKTIAKALDVGFALLGRPKVRLSRGVLLGRKVGGRRKGDR